MGIHLVGFTAMPRFVLCSREGQVMAERVPVNSKVMVFEMDLSGIPGYIAVVSRDASRLDQKVGEFAMPDAYEMPYMVGGDRIDSQVGLTKVEDGVEWSKLWSKLQLKPGGP